MPQHPLALPPSLSPEALDTLAETAIILSRIRASIQASGSGTTAAGTLPGATPAGIGATPGLGTSPGAALSLKDVPGATDGLKHKLQRARGQVRALPDMGRTVAEQEAEIRELEARIAKQRTVLDQFREAGVVFVAQDGADGADTRMEM